MRFCCVLLATVLLAFFASTAVADIVPVASVSEEANGNFWFNMTHVPGELCETCRCSRFVLDDAFTDFYLPLFPTNYEQPFSFAPVGIREGAAVTLIVTIYFDPAHASAEIDFSNTPLKPDYQVMEIGLPSLSFTVLRPGANAAGWSAAALSCGEVSGSFKSLVPDESAIQAIGTALFVSHNDLLLLSEQPSSSVPLCPVPMCPQSVPLANVAPLSPPTTPPCPPAPLSPPNMDGRTATMAPWAVTLLVVSTLCCVMSFCCCLAAALYRVLALCSSCQEQDDEPDWDEVEADEAAQRSAQTAPQAPPPTFVQSVDGRTYSALPQQLPLLVPFDPTQHALVDADGNMLDPSSLPFTPQYVQITYPQIFSV